MAFKIIWIVALCSVPLILLIVIPQSNIECSGDALCLKGKVTRVIDGDTMVVGDDHIRLALTSAPELNQAGGMESKQFVDRVCPVDSDVLVDEDDGQTSGSYGRIIAKVYCKGILLNEKILENKHGTINSDFCSKSEFQNEAWATKYGC